MTNIDPLVMALLIGGLGVTSLGAVLGVVALDTRVIH